MIYVFKTSVESVHQVEKLKPDINTLLASQKWNFDLDDCDRILRIECDRNIVPEITKLLAMNNIYCRELE